MLLQQSVVVKQGEVTRLNQDGVRLEADLSHAEKGHYEQQTHGCQLEQRLEKLQAIEERCRMRALSSLARRATPCLKMIKDSRNESLGKNTLYCLFVQYNERTENSFGGYMAGNASSANTSIRCFESAEEIRDLAEYRENNPLAKQSYRRLIGYYSLPAKMYCCLEKANGNLCKHEHGKGWVVEKDDGSYTLLGKDCANDKFGADPRLIRDIAHAANAIRRQARLDKILKHLEKQAERTRELHDLRKSVDDLYLRAQKFLGEVGVQTTRQLQAMHRSGSAQVIVTAVKYRESTEDGRTRRERSTFQHRLGVLDGLALVSRESYTSILISISNILAAFSAASTLSDRPRKGEIDALAGRLDDFDRVINQGRALMACEAQFLGNKMELLCFFGGRSGRTI